MVDESFSATFVIVKNFTMKFSSFPGCRYQTKVMINIWLFWLFSSTFGYYTDKIIWKRCFCLQNKFLLWKIFLGFSNLTILPIFFIFGILNTSNCICTNMKIAIEGCLHGELQKVYETIKEIEDKEHYKVDLLLCCGDFQVCTRNIFLLAFQLTLINEMISLFRQQEMCPI